MLLYFAQFLPRVAGIYHPLGCQRRDCAGRGRGGVGEGRSGKGVLALRLAERTRRHPTLTQTNTLKGQTTPPPTQCPLRAPNGRVGGGREPGSLGRGRRQGTPPKPGPKASGHAHTSLYTPSPFSRSRPRRRVLARILSPSSDLVLAAGDPGVG